MIMKARQCMLGLHEMFGWAVGCSDVFEIKETQIYYDLYSYMSTPWISCSNHT